MDRDRPKGVRATITRGIVRVPFLRRLYVRRMLAFLERSKRIALVLDALRELAGSGADGPALLIAGVYAWAFQPFEV